MVINKKIIKRGNKYELIELSKSIYIARERGSVRMAGVSGDTRVAEPHATLSLSLPLTIQVSQTFFIPRALTLTFLIIEGNTDDILNYSNI